MAYHLKLPEQARIHPIFHCSLLKPFHGDPTSPGTNEATQLPSQYFQNQPLIIPLAILSHRRNPQTGEWEVLVQWEGLSSDETSWEDWNSLRQEYHLEDKVTLQRPPDDSMDNAEEEVNKVTENPSTQANTGESSIQADTGESNTKVQIASKSKRKVMRLAYLKDFV